VLRLPRLVVAFLACLLVLGMQQESLRHAVEHLRPLLQRAHDTGLQLPVADAACAECALLAGGADAVAPHVAPVVDRAGVIPAGAVAFASRAVPAPVYSATRAPPALL
jgi:hypothetical protein